MRVVAGKYGSRPLKAASGMNTRPTSDKIKESIFNMLKGSLEGKKVLDFYGGSGGLAIEAVSRGADAAIICEKNRAALRAIHQNIYMTKEDSLFIVLQGNNQRSITKFSQDYPNTKFNLIFLDPPYKTQTIIEDIHFLEELDCLDLNCTIVCETDCQTFLPEKILSFAQVKCKKYGQSKIRIYERG